ncbi:hypothetical protein O1611_g5674 [Lasiodiplodia mahajangana]|uniref:Uncharacterized protein n=1 Tax=Lasiodiplodia mahajangana TaxID=1108764 RepID=A0ACC2JKI3_9PEZI|nr:hypothetical protein O1611_g5674 [Lasiodiplodia mahajangana]
MNQSKLLNHVVSHARTARFLQRGKYAWFGGMDARFGEDAKDSGKAEKRKTSHSRVVLEERTAIGLAGELFVFELLSQLKPRLPDLSRDNWQSTMRKFAAVHPDYADLKP